MRLNCLQLRLVHPAVSSLLVTPPSPATNATANLDASSGRGSAEASTIWSTIYANRCHQPVRGLTQSASSELCRSQGGGKIPLTLYRQAQIYARKGITLDRSSP